MKKLELNQLEMIEGEGTTACNATLTGMWSFAGAAMGTFTPIGVGLGVAVGGLALLSVAMGGCGN